jgi:hypothetical protein
MMMVMNRGAINAIFKMTTQAALTRGLRARERWSGSVS